MSDTLQLQVRPQKEVLNLGKLKVQRVRLRLRKYESVSVGEVLLNLQIACHNSHFLPSSYKRTVKCDVLEGSQTHDHRAMKPCGGLKHQLVEDLPELVGRVVWALTHQVTIILSWLEH